MQNPEASFEANHNRPKTIDVEAVIIDSDTEQKLETKKRNSEEKRAKAIEKVKRSLLGDQTMKEILAKAGNDLRKDFPSKQDLKNSVSKSLGKMGTGAKDLIESKAVPHLVNFERKVAPHAEKFQNFIETEGRDIKQVWLSAKDKWKRLFS